MTPDFTLIWPLSCLKDGVHLCDVFNRWKTSEITAFCGKPTVVALSGPRSLARAGRPKGRPPSGRAPRTGQPRVPLAYSPMSWSCAGWMRGGDGDSTTPPVTVA